MLTIRMQRTGRKGQAQFRMVAQDKRFSPLSGRVVAYLGNYDPHTKKAQLNGEKISHYLEKGAQPSPRAAKLLKAEGIKLPKWVSEPSQKQKTIRNPEKLRRNRPADAEPKSEVPAETEAPAADNAVEEPAAEAPAENKTDEKPVEAKPEESAIEEPKAEQASEQPNAEAPVEEAKPEPKPAAKDEPAEEPAPEA